MKADIQKNASPHVPSLLCVVFRAVGLGQKACLGLGWHPQTRPKTKCPSPSLIEQPCTGHLLLISQPFEWTEALFCTPECEASPERASVCVLGVTVLVCVVMMYLRGVKSHWLPQLCYF